MVAYKIPSVGSEVKLDRRCPHCGHNHGRIHTGVMDRGLQDWKVETVPQRRMRCPDCGITWTLRGEGVGPGRQRTDRGIGFAVMLYLWGPSYRQVEWLMEALGVRVGKSSVERDVAAAGAKAKVLHEAAPAVTVRGLGIDGTGNAKAGRKGGWLFFVDHDRQKLLCVEPVQERDAAAVHRHVRRVLAAVGAAEVRTDEHSVYRGGVPVSKHRLCLAHWRKSKGKRAWDLCRQAVAQGRPLEAEMMRELLALLRQRPRAPTVPEALERLGRRYINAHRGLPGKVNQLLQHVERTWEKVSDDPGDPTNNPTERLIGLTLKIRAKTMRGFKSDRKVVQPPYLSSFLRGEEGICDLRKVI